VEIVRKLELLPTSRKGGEKWGTLRSAVFYDYFYCVEFTGRISVPQRLVLSEVEGD